MKNFNRIRMCVIRIFVEKTEINDLVIIYTYTGHEP